MSVQKSVWLVEVMKRIGMMVRGMLVVAVAVAGGCSAMTAGVSMVPEVPASTAEFRTELEMVKDAELVVEDTMPRWPMGRCAYRRGMDRLLVLVHWTLLGERNREGQLIKPVKERFMERLWVTIPRDTRVGEVLDVEELDFKHLVGYDAGEVGDELFREPYKVGGHVTVLEEREGKAVVYVNVQVAPRRRPMWAVKGRYELELRAEGKYAKEVVEGVGEAYRLTETVKEAEVGEGKGAMGEMKREETEVQAGEKERVEEVGKEGQAVGEVKGVAVVLAGEELRKAIVGKWVHQTRRWYDWFQFDEDGTFIYANCRAGGYPPAIHAGTWEVRDQFVIVTTKHYTYGDIRNPNVDKEMPAPVVGYLRVKRVEGGLVLEGKMQNRGAMKEMAVQVSAGEFADMRVVAPPSLP